MSEFKVKQKCKKDRQKAGLAFPKRKFLWLRWRRKLKKLFGTKKDIFAWFLVIKWDKMNFCQLLKVIFVKNNVCLRTNNKKKTKQFQVPKIYETRQVLAIFKKKILHSQNFCMLSCSSRRCRRFDLRFRQKFFFSIGK